MQNIITENDLKIAIFQLEVRQAEEGILLKEQFLVAYESIKPMNLIKSVFVEAAESQDLQDNLINATVGMTVGYLSKILFQSVTNSPVKKILGTVLMFGIKNVIAQNPETVKSLGKGFFNLIRNLLLAKDKDADQNQTRTTDSI
jgi:hypothetical protein